MTMVPPMHSPTTIMVDHMAEKDSADDRVDTVQKVMREISRDRARMEYLLCGQGGQKCRREKGEYEGVLLRCMRASICYAVVVFSAPKGTHAFRPKEIYQQAMERLTE